LDIPLLDDVAPGARQPGDRVAQFLANDQRVGLPRRPFVWDTSPMSGVRLAAGLEL
jgi:hypothetical protein